ncbi:MAG: sugar porter family MFS transporter [Bryobacterales bacterium]|nr:sugar porter family MFS transporter [Bryobacterales bacterium]
MQAYSYRITAVTALSGFLFGFDTAIINGAIVFLRRQFRWTDGETELAASSLLAGCALGAGIAGMLSDRYGRRAVLLLAAAIFAVSSIATALPNSLAAFSAARIVAGLAIGIASMLAPMYIAEVSPAAIRGRLVSMNQLAIVLGILVSYLAGWALAGLGDSSWRWMFAIAALPSLLFFAALFFVPESPRWLIKEGRSNEAARILSRLGEPASQLDNIARAIAEESGSIRQLLRPGMRRPLIIVVTLAILQQVTGINTVLYYGSIIFTEQAGAQSTSAALWANVIIGAMNLVFTVIALFTIDRLGRKTLLMTAAGGMGVALTALATVFASGAANPTRILALILCYVAFFSFGMGPGVWVVIAELFPTRIRGRAMSVATVALWLACLLITFTFLSLVRAFTAAGAFAIYAALCALTVWFVWRFTPETKGMLLEEIEQHWLQESGGPSSSIP